MTASSKAKVILAGTGLAIALSAAGLAGWSQLPRLLPVASAAPISADRPAQPVRVVRVSFTVPDTSRSFTGTVRPEHETAMAFRLPGKIVARPVEVGDRVRAGDLLAKMDDTDARLSLEAAEAEVTASRTDFTRAEAETKRSESLFATGILAKAKLESAISTSAQARGRLDRALRLREQAANALSYATLVADTAGVITAVAADSGQVVAAGQPVVTVAPTDRLDVVFALPEQMRTAVENARASAVLWGEGQHAYALRLRDISPDVDPAARTYRVRMSLIDPSATVALGRTMTVTLAGRAEQPVAPLPLGAVIDDGSGAFVWRLRPHETKVERVAVSVEALKDDVAEVRGDLSEGDLVVSLGAHKLDPARPVHVVETTSAPSM